MFAFRDASQGEIIPEGVDYGLIRDELDGKIFYSLSGDTTLDEKIAKVHHTYVIPDHEEWRLCLLVWEYDMRLKAVNLATARWLDLRNVIMYDTVPAIKAETVEVYALEDCLADYRKAAEELYGFLRDTGKHRTKEKKPFWERDLHVTVPFPDED